MVHLKKLLLGVALAVGVGANAAAAGIACPNGVIKMVVANPAGGAGDVIARLISEKAGAALDEHVVVENRAGATTTIGTAVVAQAKPDGCTLLAMPGSTVVAGLLHKVPYDLQHDLVPFIGIGSLPMALAVSEKSGFKSMQDLAAAAKSPKGITYGSGGPGTMAHLAAVRLITGFGGTGNHIPYRGNADVMQGLLGNQVQLAFFGTAEVLPQLKTGRIRVLAVTSGKRVPAMADVPTTKELGFNDFNPRLWYVLLAPAGTPPETLTRLHDAFAKSLTDPSVQERLKHLDFDTELQSSAEAAALIQSETERWAKVIKQNNISME